MSRCEHCLGEAGGADTVTREIGGRALVFCCPSCLTVYEFIRGEGLGEFYDKRKWEETGPGGAAADAAIDPAPYQANIVPTEDGRNSIDLYVDGIRCASCVWLTERVLKKTPGVESARVNYATHKARVVWRPGEVELGEILRRIVWTGYVPKPYTESERLRAERAERTDLLVRLGTACFLSMQLMLYTVALYAGYFQGMDPQVRRLLEFIAMFLTIPVLLYSAMPLIRSTLRGLVRLRFNMDSLITMGAFSAFVYSVYGLFTGGEVYFDTSAMIVTLILIGRYIESAAKGRASETLDKLAELAPDEALRVDRDGATGMTVGRIMVQASSLVPGDLVEVRPGGRIPADCEVISGQSEADESMLTGESRPVPKAPGDAVIGGSMNLTGTLTMCVTRTGRDTVLSGIIRAVEEAQAARPEIQALADRIVGVFVPGIIALAIATLVGYLWLGYPANRALMTSISVLVIACPCSLGLATPLAILVYSSMASSQGILIKGGVTAENATRINRVVFDKTGTITTGRPSLAGIVILDQGITEEGLLAIAASAELKSEHALGRAVYEAAYERTSGFSPVEPESFRATPGKGIEAGVSGHEVRIGKAAFIAEGGCQFSLGLDVEAALARAEHDGGTVIYVAWDGRLRGALILSDTARPSARGVIESLGRLGYDVTILSGDNERTTASIAARVGAGGYHAGKLPTEKRAIVAEYQRGGEKVLMVGDGINDAPALTEALVGAAMGRGTDIAMHSADVVLIREDLSLIPYFLDLSKGAFRIIKQNIFWSFFYNIVAIPLAVAGVLHPIVAAGAMATSSLIVVVNSLRIKKMSARLRGIGNV